MKEEKMTFYLDKMEKQVKTMSRDAARAMVWILIQQVKHLQKGFEHPNEFSTIVVDDHETLETAYGFRFEGMSFEDYKKLRKQFE